MLVDTAARFTAADIADVVPEGGAFRARTRVRLLLKSHRAITLVSAYDFGSWLSDDPWEVYESWPQRLAAEIKRLLGIGGR